MRAGLLLIGLPLLIAAPALSRAQAVTGSLEGRIVSADGAPLQGAVVTASSPFLQGTIRAVTDAAGGFRLAALPPGAYELRLAQVGFRPLVVRQVAVALGRTTGLDPLVMTPQPVEMEPLVVTAQVVTLDPVHTTVGGTLDPADFAGLPGDRDYRSLLAVLPHANESTRGDAVNVAGNTGLENRYYIDGVNVTDPRDASRATSLPYNFVRAVEVKAGGYEAQYGRALGAVVNAVTYTGTNDFEASGFAFVQPSALALDPRVAPVITESGAVGYDVGLRVGGPIRRDGLWYSVAVNPRVDQVDKEIFGHGFFRDRTTAVRFAGKLTWQASASTGLELSVFGDPTTRDGVDGICCGITSVANPDALLNRQTSGGVTGSLRATVRVGTRVLLEGTVARQWDRYSLEGATAIGRSQPRVEDQVTGVLSGGYWVSQHDDRGRTTLMARATFSLGAHTVVAGAEYEDGLVSWQFSKVGSGFGGTVTRYASDSTTWVADYQNYGGPFHNRSPAAYLQDSWQMGSRFVLNAGVRWSGQFFTGASGRVALRFADEWQPRAGFSWQVGRLGTQRVFGSYGRVYETLPEFLASIWFLDSPYIYRFYHSDPTVPGTVPDSIQNNTTTEAQGSVTVPGSHADNYDEYSLGYERLIGSATRLTVRGLYRHLRSAFLVGYDPSRNPFWAMGTPGQGTFDFLPAPRREYTALEIAAEGAWRGIRYRASYVLSRSWGNYTGGYSSDVAGSVAQPGANVGLVVPAQAANSTGLLPNDRTHVFKLSGAHTFAIGLEAGAFLTAQSGSPINAFVPADWGYPQFVVPRGGAGRTPALWNLDLRLAWAVPFMNGPSGRMILDALHVGNPRGTTLVNEWTGTNYLQATAYQPPMAMRLGMELTF